MKRSIKRNLILVMFSILFLLSLNFFMAYKGYMNDIFGRNKLQDDFIIGIILFILGMITLIVYIIISKKALPSPYKKIIFKEENILKIEKKYKKIEVVENIDFIKTKYNHFNLIYKEYIVLFNIKKMPLNILEEIENEISIFKKEVELNITKVRVLYIVCIIEKTSPELLNNLKVRVLEKGYRGVISSMVIPIIIETKEENIISSSFNYKTIQEMYAFIQQRNRFLRYLVDIDLVKYKD